MANPMPWWACIALALAGLEYTRDARSLDASYGGGGGGGGAALRRRLTLPAEDTAEPSLGVPGVEDAGDAGAGTLDASHGGDAAGDGDGAGVEDTGDAGTLDVSSLLPGMGDTAGGLNASFGGWPSLNASALVPEGDIPNVSDVLKNILAMEFNVTVPCLSILGILEVVEPCGNLTVPEDGINFTTIFGNFHVPGTRPLKKEVMGAERFLSHYTGLSVLIGVLIWVATTLLIPSRREKFFKTLKDTCGGKLYGEEEDEEDPPTEEEKRARLDPLSKEFIAPGNIYRLLAVLHPGIIGVRPWFGYSSKAFICAYMQLYLPYNVIKNVFVTWHFSGIKSPLWCRSERPHPQPQGAAGGGAADPRPPPAARRPGERGASRFGAPEYGRPRHLHDRDGAPRGVRAGGPADPGVATYTGDIGDVAITAVSLYFIFDLDDKVMEADPKLRLKYRRTVAQQTEKRPKESCPRIMPVVASTSAAIVKLTVPLGLMGIVLFAWRNKLTGFVIGGDGVTI